MGKYSERSTELLNLHKEGFSLGQIAKMMTAKYKIKFLKANIGKVLVKNSEYKPSASFYDKNYTKGRKEIPQEYLDKIEAQMLDSGISNDDEVTWKHGWLKDKNGASIFIKNMSEVVSLDDMLDEFADKLNTFSPKYRPIKRDKIEDPHLLVIDIADLHIGKLADASETNDEYNNEIAIERAVKGVEGILSKAKGFPIDKILFVIGNDVLHTDGASPTTTSGTPQDMTKKWHRNFTEARDMYVGIIDRIRLLADVHIVHNPSNHDFVSGFMLANVIHAWFRNCKNVTFNVTNNHRKYFRYGNSLIGTSHGDGAKIDQLPLLMANEAKHDWADTYWRYIYLHHVHHKDYFKFRSGKDYQGCTVEYLRSPSGTDAWHQKKGFTLSPKAIEGFIHSFEHGQVARLTHLFR